MKVVAIAHGDDLPVVSVHLPRAAAIAEETSAPAASEVPAIAQTAPEKAASDKGKEK